MDTEYPDQMPEFISDDSPEINRVPASETYNFAEIGADEPQPQFITKNVKLRSNGGQWPVKKITDRTGKVREYVTVAVVYVNDKETTRITIRVKTDPSEQLMPMLKVRERDSRHVASAVMSGKATPQQLKQSKPWETEKISFSAYIPQNPAEMEKFKRMFPDYTTFPTKERMVAATFAKPAEPAEDTVCAGTILIVGVMMAATTALGIATHLGAF